MLLRAKLLGAAAAILLAAVPARAASLSPVNAGSTTSTLDFSWSGAGSYVILLSTDSKFTVTAASGPIAANTTHYINLSPDTTYYFRVKLQTDPDSLYALNTATQPTVAAAPTGMYFNDAYFTAQSSFTAVIKAGWNTNSNPAWTRYEVTYDVVPTFTSNPVTVPKTSPGGDPAEIGGLNANTTYYMKVRARGVNGALTAETLEISTATLAINLPGINADVFETSATVKWTAVNNGGARDSEGYRLALSLSELLTPSVISWSSANKNDAATDLTPLLRNTTYFYSVNTVNWNGVSDLTAKRSFTTLAAKPQNLALASVSSTTARLNWTELPAAPANLSAQGYRLEGSSMSFDGSDTPLYTVNQNVAQSTLTLSGLDENTTYYLRAASINLAGSLNYTTALTTVTLAPPPSANMQYVYAETDALTVLINALPGNLQRTSCEGYKLLASSTNFNGTGDLLSTSTPNPQPLTLSFSGLRPNTPYYMRLGTLNWNGTPNYSDLTPTATLLPARPSGVKLVAVWQSSASVNFSVIPGGDSYTLEASTHEFFNTIQRSSATFDAGVTTLTVTALDLNTRYYFRVAALYNGTTVYTTASPSNKSTLPESLDPALFAGVFYSSVTVSWTPLPGFPQLATAEAYLLEAATTQAFTTVLFSSGTNVSAVDHLTLTGLAPNTSYYFRAGALNWDGAATYSFTPATATLANSPTQQNYRILPLALTPVWLTNSNPPDTVYLAELAANAGFTVGLVSSATVLSSATFSGLTPNTTYYTRVTAINRLNRASPTVVFSPMATGAYDPDYAPYGPSDIGVSSVTSRWGAGTPANPAGTYYLATISSSTDASGSLTGAISSSVTVNLYASFPGLMSNASYYMRVSALNLTGVPTDPPVDLHTALTLPATPYILAPEQTFSGMLTDGFTVNWQDNNNSSVTVYNVRVSTAQDFSVFTSSLSVKGLSCSFKDLLIDTTYWAQVRARGQSGIYSEYESAGSTVTLSTAVLNAVALQDSLVTLQTSYGEISVHLPRGSIGSSTILVLKALTPSTATFSAPISAVSKLTPTGVGLSITHFPPTIIFGAITITLPYRISDLPPGTDRSKLILALFDEQNAVWVPLPSVSDTGNNRVIGQTWHLSTFQIMQAQSEAGLANVKIYPNPYRPNSVSDVMHFTNMPPYAKVKFYTFLGELVREIKADVNGMAHWDGLNNDGRRAASGIYIAFIQTKDKKNGKSFKVALER